MATFSELEQRLAVLEDQVRVLVDQRVELLGIQRRLGIMQAALDNHTAKLGEHGNKLDILIDGVAEVVRILRSRGDGS